MTFSRCPDRSRLRRSLWGVGASAICVQAVLAQGPTLRPGQYEKTIQASIAGRGSGRSRTELLCITADDVKDLSKKLNVQPKEENCTRSDYKQTSAGVSYTQHCAVGDGSRLTFKVDINILSAESFRATVNTSSSNLSSTAAAASPLLQGSTITMTAKRVGDCTK